MPPPVTVLTANIPLTSLHDDAVTDRRLSLRARGLLLVLMSAKDGSPPYPPCTPGESTEEIDAALDELAAFGYFQHPTTDHPTGVITDIPGQYDTPIEEAPLEIDGSDSVRRADMKKVYAIGNIEVGCVKIGISDDPEVRLKGMQTACPHRLSLLWAGDGGRSLEDYLHGRFRWRRLEGEWFDFSGESEAGIAKKINFAVRRWARLNENGGLS